jgi:glycosyltransferase involved in cell wall biosynthesis
MSRSRKLVVVKNLGTNVSWSKSYIEAAEKTGCRITSTIDASSPENRIYIGDSIDYRSLGERACNICFLAAADCTEQEHDNILMTNHTTTVSQAEKARITGIFQDINETKITVDGFPVDVDSLELIKSLGAEKIEKSVCFLGRSDADKGPSLEIEMARLLREQDYKVFHLSPCKISIADELISLGVNVFEGITGRPYLKLLSRMGCVINTSPRESLFVSGIEASVLGVPVIAPNAIGSGIADWNKPEYFYSFGDSQSAVNLVKQFMGQHNILPDLDRFSAEKYFERINRHISHVLSEDIAV